MSTNFASICSRFRRGSLRYASPIIIFSNQYFTICPKCPQLPLFPILVLAQPSLTTLLFDFDRCSARTGCVVSGFLRALCDNPLTMFLPAAFGAVPCLPGEAAQRRGHPVHPWVWPGVYRPVGRDCHRGGRCEGVRGLGQQGCSDNQGTYTSFHPWPPQTPAPFTH